MENSGPIFTYKIIWAALTFAMVMYTVVTGTTQGWDYLQGLEQELNSFNKVLLAAMGAGVFAIILSEILPKILASKNKINLNTVDEQTLYQKSFIVYIIRWVLLDSAVIFGLVASFIIRVNVVIIFFVPAAMMMLRAFPTKESVKNYYR